MPKAKGENQSLKKNDAICPQLTQKVNEQEKKIQRINTKVDNVDHGIQAILATMKDIQTTLVVNNDKMTREMQELKEDNERIDAKVNGVFNHIQTVSVTMENIHSTLVVNNDNMMREIKELQDDGYRIPDNYEVLSNIETMTETMQDNNDKLTREMQDLKEQNKRIIVHMNKTLKERKVNGDDAAFSSANSGDNPERLMDILSEDLKCPICLEMLRLATTLGCGHSLCSDCLQEVRDTNGSKCPVCRANISSTTRSVMLDNIISSMIDNQ